MDHVSMFGIDPGIVHTGCVNITVNKTIRAITIHHKVISGVDASKVREWVDSHTAGPVFIEDYNPGNYVREDKKMSEALGRLKEEFPPSEDPIVRYVDNAGINTLIPRPVLEAFKCYAFSTRTHHNDLVSAAKIALLGAIKDNSPGLELREIVSNVVLSDGKWPWRVYHV